MNLGPKAIRLSIKAALLYLGVYRVQKTAYMAQTQKYTCKEMGLGEAYLNFLHTKMLNQLLDYLFIRTITCNALEFLPEIQRSKLYVLKFGNAKCVQTSFVLVVQRLAIL